MSPRIFLDETILFYLFWYLLIYFSVMAVIYNIHTEVYKYTRSCGTVVLVCDFYTGSCSSIPTHGDSLGKWMNLRPGQPMPCEGNWVIISRCWQDTYIHSAYNYQNGLLSLLQFNHIEINTAIKKHQCKNMVTKLLNRSLCVERNKLIFKSVVCTVKFIIIF